MQIWEKEVNAGGGLLGRQVKLVFYDDQSSPSLIPGIRPINPLDVLDLVLLHRRDNAFILDTWTL